MLKQHIYSFIVLLILLFSCNKNNNFSHNYKTISVNLNQVEKISLEDLFSDIEFLKISSDSSYIMGGVNEFRIHNNKFYFESDDSIFIFSNDGIFINKINLKGEGPGEYTQISDFYIDEANQNIEIYDSKLRKVFVYDKNGKYLNKIDVGLDGYSLTKLTNNSDYAAYIGSSYYNEYSNSRLNIINSKGKLIQRHIPIKPNEAKFLHVADLTNFTRYRDSLRFLYGFNDTIYSIYNNTKISPTYYVDFGKHKLPKEFLERTYTDVREFFERCGKTDYAYRLIGFFETDDIIYFSFRYKDDLLHALHFKNNDQTLTYDVIDMSIVFPNIVRKTNFLNLPKSTANGKLYVIMNPYEFKETMDEVKSKMNDNEWDSYLKTHSKLASYYNEFSLLDNPILMILTPKKSI